MLHFDLDEAEERGPRTREESARGGWRRGPRIKEGEMANGGRHTEPRGGVNIAPSVLPKGRR